MDSSYANAERKIDTVAFKHGLSEQGKLWMENALDPFPDIPRKSEGYPDTVCGPSITQKLKMSYTITSNLGDPNLPWDCLIQTTEVENAVPLSSYTCTGDAQTPSLNYATKTATAFNYGGLMIWTKTPGGTMGVADTRTNLAPSQTYFNDGRTRVIAKGFEVTNTTPELYRGGAVTVFRDPQVTADRATNMYAAGSYMTSGGYVTGITFPITTCFQSCSGAGPVTFSQIQQLDGTRTWGADEGCYVTATMGSTINEPIEETDTQLLTTYDAATPSTFYTQPVGQVGVTNYKLPTNTGAYPSAFNRSGAYFTGLDGHSTLTVVYHVIVERFVNENALDLIVLTTKSPSFDPEALELYSRAATILPTGVPVNENDDGDWIKNVAGMLGTLGVPGMGFVSGAVDLYNGMNKKKKPQQQQKQQQNNNNKKQITKPQERKIERVVEKKIEQRGPKRPRAPKKRRKQAGDAWPVPRDRNGKPR